MKAREVERKIKKVSENKREMEIEEEEERLTARKLGCYCCCPEETPSRCQDFLKIPRYPKRSTSANRIRTRNEEQLMILYIFERACAHTHTHNFPVPRKNHFEELSRFTLIRCRLIALHETETKTRRFKMVEKSFWFHKETQKDGQIREGGRKRENDAAKWSRDEKGRGGKWLKWSSFLHT